MLPTDYQSYIHLSRYARWRDDLQRRETWKETVQRYFDFFHIRLYEALETNEELQDKMKYYQEFKIVQQAVLDLEVMPSMRALMTSGEALEKDNCGGYNCCYVAVDDPHVFDEIMYMLMCGTGVGFSVEKQYVNLLPTITSKMYPTNTSIVIEDSKIGWASGYRELLALLWNGKVPKWDMSRVRPAGSRLKTFGGRASGPEPLDGLFKFTVTLFKTAAGRKLTTLECHDLVCKVADIVVVGGVRRSALISLSDLEDLRMRNAKSGNWWATNGHRRLANNSAVYTEKPPIGVFMDEWVSLFKSNSGERGILNRGASIKQAAKNTRRKVKNADGSFIQFGTNPCSEIILRNKEFCNLSEVVIRPDDSFTTVAQKVKYATILGTLQSTLTDFRYLSDDFRKNTKEEHLLGVSMTGILDHTFFSGKEKDFEKLSDSFPGMKLPEALNALKQVAIDTNKEWAKVLGIDQSTAITCVKPSGTVSQLVNAASGIHPRYAHYYIRRIRADKKDPVSKLMRDAGVPVEDDITSPQQTDVFSFPMEAPDTAILRDDMTALDQLKLTMIYQKHWCEHKPSITIYVREPEWMEVGAYVYKNFDDMCGIAFLPYDSGSYRQAPYEEIDRENYEKALVAMPINIDWSLITKYETEDQTTNSKELACSSGHCEI
jgi:ribonucleoside-diphosphate reductase alpha chain